MSRQTLLIALALGTGLVAVAAPGFAEMQGGGADGQATEGFMAEADIRAALGGQAIDGHYRNGRTFSESYAADGRISYRDDYRASGGRWSLVNGAFCTIYDGDPSGGCFRVRRSGANCFEFYFVARTEEEAKAPRKPDWTARGWRSDAKSTCVDGANA